MASLGQLVVNLEANIARFTQDMQRASQQTEQAMNRMQGAADKVKNVLALIGVGLSVGTLVGEVNRTIDALASLDGMAQKTGASVEMLSKLSKVASFTGTEFGAVDGALVKLSKNLNDVDDKSSKAAKALAAIGISTKDIKDQDPAQVFVQVAQKLKDYETSGAKVALVTDLMGQSAADLLPYMNNVAESIDDFAAETAEAAANAAALQDDMGLLRVKYNEVATAIVTAALPAAKDFLDALVDTTREANALTSGTSVDTWADDVAIGLARVIDYAKLTVGTLGAIGGSIKTVAADIMVLATLNPGVMAYELAQGRNPLDNFRAAMAERDTILAEANGKWDRLINAPVHAVEDSVVKRIRGRQNAAGLAAAGEADVPPSPSLNLNYSSGDEKKDKDKDKEWTRAAAADRMVRFALDETLAIRNTEKVTESLIDTEARRLDQQTRAAERIASDGENIRQSLMTDAEHEQFTHDSRIERLQAFSALRLEGEMVSNALIEAETARHAQAKADIEAAQQSQILGMAGDSADQLYSLMQQAGMEKTALGKALFMANKAIAVAEIIQSTEVAAAKALEMGPIAGPILAGVIRGMGYASAGIVIGQTIASAEGGYDIPAGVNPVTQLHEKEMVLPKAQAEVIRGLAAGGGAGGAGGAVVHYSPQIHIDSRTDQQEVRKLVSTAVQQGNADLVDKLQRAGRI